jgi:hypothetical protein
MQGAYSGSHAWSANQCVQKVRGSQLMSCSTLILFTCVVPCTKRKGLLIDAPFYSYTFYTCNTVYKKQGDPDRHLILLLYFLYVQHRVRKARSSQSTSHSTLILFTRTTPSTKSKGLSIDVPFYSYTFYMHNATYKKHGAPDHGVSILHIPVATMEVAQDQFATRQVGLG